MFYKYINKRTGVHYCFRGVVLGSETQWRRGGKFSLLYTLPCCSGSDRKNQAEVFQNNSNWNFLHRNESHTILLTAVGSLFTLYFAGTAMSVPVFIAAYTEYYRGRTVQLDDAKILFVYCKHYHVEVFLRQKIEAEFSEEYFSLRYLPWKNLHMIMLAVVVNMLTLCFASTPMSVLMFIVPGTGELRGQKVEVKKSQLWIGPCEYCVTVDLGE